MPAYDNKMFIISNLEDLQNSPKFSWKFTKTFPHNLQSEPLPPSSPSPSPTRPHHLAHPLLLKSGGGQHHIGGLQLQRPPQPGVCLSARGAVLGRPQGGGGAAGEEVPGRRHPGALGAHRAHADPPAQQSHEQSLTTSPRVGEGSRDVDTKKFLLSRFRTNLNRNVIF